MFFDITPFYEKMYIISNGKVSECSEPKTHISNDVKRISMTNIYSTILINEEFDSKFIQWLECDIMHQYGSNTAFLFGLKLSKYSLVIEKFDKSIYYFWFQEM